MRDKAKGGKARTRNSDVGWGGGSMSRSKGMAKREDMTTRAREIKMGLAVVPLNRVSHHTAAETLKAVAAMMRTTQGTNAFLATMGKEAAAATLYTRAKDASVSAASQAEVRAEKCQVGIPMDATREESPACARATRLPTKSGIKHMSAIGYSPRSRSAPTSRAGGVSTGSRWELEENTSLMALGPRTERVRPNQNHWSATASCLRDGI